VDINQQGVAVSRFNIVKAMCDQSPLLKSAFNLIAQKQTRHNDIFYKLINNDITNCLKNIRDIKRIKENNYKVDRMWERLIDIIQFVKTKEHKKLNDTLKGFLNQKPSNNSAINKKECDSIKNVCKFLHKVFAAINKKDNPLFYDYTNLYTAITTIIKYDMLSTLKFETLLSKFIKWSDILEKQRLPGASQSLQQCYKRYRDAASRHSSDTTQRETRCIELYKILTMK